MLYQQVDTMVQSAVRGARGSSSEASGNSWGMHVEELETAPSRNSIVTDASTVDYKNAWLWE